MRMVGVCWLVMGDLLEINRMQGPDLRPSRAYVVLIRLFPYETVLIDLIWSITS